MAFMRADLSKDTDCDHGIMCLFCVEKKTKNITPVQRSDAKPWPGQCCAPSLELEFIPINTRPE